jgi:glycolate oxidase FAD binding subunit
VKNVAGYDLPKLFIGSFGTLGAIVEATFKVRPLPAADVSLAAACADVAQAGVAALALLDGALSPYAVDVCNAAAAAELGLPESAHVLVRLGGEVAEVNDQRDRLARLLPGCEVIEPSRAALRAAAAPPSERWRDFALHGALTCRLSLLPGDLASFLAPLEDEARSFGARLHLLAHAGSGTAHLRVEIEASPLPFLRWLRFAARQRGGHLFVERLPLEDKRGFDVWGDPPAPLELMRRVKEAFDPKHTFSPGRFVF